MADFVPPPGPPPPKVPEGWVARWNDQYKEWFYVNTYTKKSQWEKPTEPAVPPRDDAGAPAGPPPSYSAGDSKPVVSDTKTNPYDNPANRAGGPGGNAGSSSYEDEDARLARQLQAEEDARAAAAANNRAHTPSGSQSGSSSFPTQLPPRPDQNDRGGSKGSFLGKIFGAAGKVKQSGSSSGHHGYPGHPQGGHSPIPYGGSPAPYGGQPPVGYGGYPQQQGAYGGYPPQQGYGGYPPQQGAYYGGGGYATQQAYGRPARSGGGGMGMMGGAALGLGAGVLGGALIADAVNDHDQEIYQDGYSKSDQV
ncbi:hypothetical protein B0T20DRAFT_356901 [Sordaria brevicollis]|uniref:WW domain-containing protein n=1 Tax=Sordaria brevicollis TaxID=83679 RepID=A0AAE0UAS5_SORBR|nr:hypothetical protein B0T20DRAFT_356901 [Sordaria brevicollis]